MPAQAITYSATPTFSYLLGANGTMTYGSGNADITITNVPDGGVGGIVLIQDATGSRTIDITGSTGYTNVLYLDGDLVISTDPNSVSLISYWRIGSILIVTKGKFS